MEATGWIHGDWASGGREVGFVGVEGWELVLCRLGECDWFALPGQVGEGEEQGEGAAEQKLSFLFFVPSPSHGLLRLQLEGPQDRSRPLVVLGKPS